VIKFLTVLVFCLMIVVGTLQLWQATWKIWKDDLRSSFVSSTVVATPSAKVRQIVGVSQPPLTTYSETLRRPVFFETRQLPRPEPIAPPPSLQVSTPPPPFLMPVAPPPQAIALTSDRLRLRGVGLASGGARALIEVPPEPAQWLAKGASVLGWTIEAIEANKVRLSASGQTATLDLYADGSAN
jgi:hypothetical protein